MADQTVGQHQIHDFTLQSDTQHANPFQTRLSATFTHNSGATIDHLPGFYDGKITWKIRFSPTLEGTWTGKTTSDDPALDGLDLDPILCTPNPNPHIKGILQIDPENSRRFAWSNNDPCLPLGFEIDWLFSYHQADPGRCYKHVDLIAERGFNYIVTNLYAHTGFATRENNDTRPVDPEYIFGPPEHYLFEGTNDNPDHSRLNITFLQDFDRLMAYLHQKSLIVHLMLQVQNKGVNWPARRSPEDDRFWRYIVARYQAYSNLIWDVGKESKNLLRQTGSHAYTLERMVLIRGADAYHHLVTVHDVEQRNAGIHSEPDRASDFVSDQIHLKDVGRYNREAIRRLRTLEKPYMNIEYGYELGTETLKTYTGASTAPWQDILK
ncbi:MAG: DUF5060 domain-containing protein, partial [bacterium]|nr:DUF5060 domain-containing protein [bacterium]